MPRPGSVLPPWDDDPYILSFQHYGVVAEVVDGGCLVELASAVPSVYGPFARPAPQGLARQQRSLVASVSVEHPAGPADVGVPDLLLGLAVRPGPRASGRRTPA